MVRPASCKAEMIVKVRWATNRTPAVPSGESLMSIATGSTGKVVPGNMRLQATKTLSRVMTLDIARASQEDQYSQENCGSVCIVTWTDKRQIYSVIEMARSDHGGNGRHQKNPVATGTFILLETLLQVGFDYKRK